MYLNPWGTFYLLGPICNIPVAVRPGQDPNVRMEIHLETECSVVTGKVKTKSTPTCARGNCKKVLFSPIRCDVRSLFLMISTAFHLIYMINRNAKLSFAQLIAFLKIIIVLLLRRSRNLAVNSDLAASTLE